jgi:hypothetical protein
MGRNIWAKKNEKEKESRKALGSPSGEPAREAESGGNPGRFGGMRSSRTFKKRGKRSGRNHLGKPLLITCIDALFLERMRPNPKKTWTLYDSRRFLL